MKISKVFSIVFFMVLFSQFANSQRFERELLKGKIISDSMEVENITVFNLSAKNAVITNIEGEFYIKAIATDTLYFQGVSFVSKQYVLTEKDFKNEVLEIQLYVKINELNEVVVSPYTLTGNLHVDTQKIKVIELDLKSIDLRSSKTYDDDRFYKAPQNTAVSSHFAPNGSNIDFKIIGNFIGNILGIKGNPKKYSDSVYEQRRLRDIQSKSYSQHIKERFSNHFFQKALKIKEEEVVDFLIFSEPDLNELAELLKPNNNFKLTDYLVQKSQEFNNKKSKEILSLPNEK